MVSGHDRTSNAPVAWVTGASRGLGRAIAVGLAAEGYDLVLTARSEVDLKGTAEQVRGVGSETMTLPLDVGDPGAVRQAADTIAAKWGRLDVCVAAAGISPFLKDSFDVTDDEWREVLGVNLNGAFWTAREAGRLMRDTQSRGSIVLLSSVHGRNGGAQLVAYSASKGAVEAMVRTLAKDWATHGIRVNALAPGYFETDLTAGLRQSDRRVSHLLSKMPMGRFGLPSELVPAAVFLATDASSYVTGSVLMVDGGWGIG